MKDYFLEQVHKQVSIYSYISRFISLKKRGKSFVGLCPFHKEKTPSFTVSIEKNLYYCFGCKATGDIFKFVMDYESVSFTEAQSILSDYSGIPFSRNINSSNHELYTSVNQKFLNFYKSQLFLEQGKKALEYLKSRNLSEQLIRTFQIGFAPESFHYHQTQMNLSETEVKISLKLGLIKLNKEKNGSYSFFRNRIIFPIINMKSQVVAFSGRRIKDSVPEAKYLNSENSDIFDKKKIFFNFFQAKPSIIQAKVAIIVEGFMDVIGLYNKGFKNTIACMGTALSVHHIRHLKNIVDRAILIFDSDEAGQKAAFLACQLSYLENFSLKIMSLENGQDPFDLSLSYDKEKLAEFIYSEKLMSSSDFMINRLLNKVNQDSSPEEKRISLQKVYFFLKEFHKKSDREIFLKLCSDRLGISYTTLLLEYYNQEKNIENRNSIQSKKIDNTNKNNLLEECERKVLLMLIQYPFLFNFYEDILKMEFSDSLSAFLWQFIYTKNLNNQEINYLEFFSSYNLPKDIKDAFSHYFIQEDFLSFQDIEYDKYSIEKIFKNLIYRQKLLLIDNKIDALSDESIKNFDLLSKYKNEKFKILNNMKFL